MGEAMHGEIASLRHTRSMSNSLLFINWEKRIGGMAEVRDAVELPPGHFERTKPFGRHERLPSGIELWLHVEMHQ
jgi:hypothetical protein